MMALRKWYVTNTMVKMYYRVSLYAGCLGNLVVVNRNSEKLLMLMQCILSKQVDQILIL